MRKALSLALVLALLLALAACGGAGASTGGPEAPANPESSQTGQETPPAASQDAPSSQEPEREPMGSPAVIAYPELLTDELTASPLYQQALARPSVIVYQGEILTDPQPVHDFLAAVERGEDWDLYYYNFDSYGTPSVSFDHFFTDGGKVYLRSEFEYSRETLIERTDFTYPVARLELNDYGYLTYHDVSDSGFAVISDRDLYDDALERRQMRKTYLSPIYYTGIGSGGTWSTPFVDMSWLYFFEDIYNYENEDSPWDRFGSDWPVDAMAETLSRYFDGVTADVVIASFKPGDDRYDPAARTFHYEGGRGGAIPDARVTGWSRDGDLLAIDYHRYEYYSGLPVGGESRRLTVRLMEDGSFRYLSNLEL